MIQQQGPETTSLPKASIKDRLNLNQLKLVLVRSIDYGICHSCIAQSSTRRQKETSIDEKVRPPEYHRLLGLLLKFNQGPVFASQTSDY